MNEDSSESFRAWGGWFRMIMSLGGLFVLACCIGVQGQTPPYGEGWAVQHHDPHNGDFLPVQFRDFTPANSLRQIHWRLNETNQSLQDDAGPTETKRFYRARILP